MRFRRFGAFALVCTAILTGLSVVGHSPEAGAGGRSVLVLGDSLSVGDDQFGKLPAKLQDAGFGSVEVDALVGRSTRLGVRKLMERSAVPEVVIVALGTNDVALGRSAESFRDYVERTVEYVGPDRLVVWVDIAMAGGEDVMALTAEYNQVLASEAKDSSNLVVARWSTRQPGSMLARDGVHLSPDGYRKRATFLSEVTYFFSTLQYVNRRG